MASYTKKTTTKVDSEVKEEAKVETVKEPEKRTFEPEDLIPCRSIISGALYIEGIRSKILYTWADCDDVQDVEYRDLIYMVRSRGDKNIYSPRIIIEDADFVEQNKLVKDLYESMYTTVDLREIIDLPIPQMVEEINKLPKGAKDAVKGIASTMIDARYLDSVQKIKALDEVFGTQMLLTLVQD